MKLRQEFILREIAGDTVLIPLMSQSDAFQGVISLNETGTFIWKQLVQEKEKEQIVEAMFEEYEVTEEKARQNVEQFCQDLQKLGIL